MRESLVWIAPVSSSPDGLSVMVLNIGPLLRAEGCELHLLVPENTYDAATLDTWVATGAIDSYGSYSSYRAEGFLAFTTKLLVHPALKNRFRYSAHKTFVETLDRLIRDRNATAVIVSDRSCLFAIPHLRNLRIVVSWGDSSTLALRRQIALSLREGRYRGLFPLVREFFSALGEESYYPRFAHGNIVVSPVDRAIMQSVSGRPVTLMPLGVDRITHPNMDAKVPGRLVFSGVMNFEPNVQSALWFIDNVLPRVLARRPDVHLVLVGRDPVSALVAKRSEHVHLTGRVPSVAEEIAIGHLYIAPMISGSGFKNKVVEALAAGTAVIGTSLASEFLEDELKSLIPTEDDPAALSEAILNFLELPWPELERRILAAQACLRRKHSWKQSTQLFLNAIRQ